jgi:sigma-B regulation protein RsbQ
MPNASMVLLNATGHCPNLSAPEETAAAIDQFVRRSAPALR